MPKALVLVVGTVIWDGAPWRSARQERLGEDPRQWIWKDPKDTDLPVWQWISGSVVSREELSQEMIPKDTFIPLIVYFCFNLGQTTSPTSTELFSHFCHIHAFSNHIIYTCKCIYIYLICPIGSFLHIFCLFNFSQFGGIYHDFNLYSPDNWWS